MPRSQGTSRKGKPGRSERSAGMGRALAKTHRRRFVPKSNGSSRGHGMHMAPNTTSIGLPREDGSNMLSVLEMDDLTDFLQQAEMAGREFESERERFVMLDPSGQEVLPERQVKLRWSDQPNPPQFRFRELSVPRRPKWDAATTPAELDRSENEAFLEWRRQIARREEQAAAADGSAQVRVTPFEKNLQVWRQLWRVLERCSLVLQIVDARNPLFYLSEDLRIYAEEELRTPVLIVINKADFLTPRQRQVWHEYFEQQNKPHVFFSAFMEQQKLDEGVVEVGKVPLKKRQTNEEEEEESEDDDDDNPNTTNESNGAVTPQDGEKQENPSAPPAPTSVGIDSPLTRQQLLDFLEHFSFSHNCQPDPRFQDRVQYGMVGFPNVGKSSVINVLLGASKHAHGVSRVGVASQPGKTKHFQTLLLEDRPAMMLCDCPGLVFPSFVSSTADLIAAGVFPIAQMRDPWPVVELICQRIPREILNAQYGIKLPVPPEYERGPESASFPSPTAEELLSTYCIARSMLAASSGVPDYQRASRIIIRDYAEGKLLYCHPPPPSGTNHDDLFRKETVLLALAQKRKLRERLEKQREKQQQQQQQETDNADTMLLLEDDLDILEAMQGMAVEDDKEGGKRGKKHKSRQKWGKKGRKGRNKDPYGCHSTPDEELFGGDSSSGGGGGVVVNGGKYSRKGYTRPTNYGGVKGVAQFDQHKGGVVEKDGNFQF